MDIQNPDFRGLKTEDLQRLQRSLQLELSDRSTNTKEKAHDRNMKTMQYLRDSLFKQTQAESQQSIAKSEAEINARAERLIESASKQRVIL